MNAHDAKAATPLTKPDPAAPALLCLGPRAIAIRAGTIFNGNALTGDTQLELPAMAEPGTDWIVHFVDGTPRLDQLATPVPFGTAPMGTTPILGGFHFAPGGNASARAGGDDKPAINPHSMWDVKFRPACPDPRGMALVTTLTGKCWVDIYLLGVDHLTDGTSKCGATIADGNDRPLHPQAGRRYSRFDYEAACAVLAHHGKGPLSFVEYFAAAFGVTERSAIGDDPRITGLDAPRTSRYGLMQASGNLWVWGHDGDPDQPRASIFGGSWICGGAGSRYAVVGSWPEDSYGDLGARGRCDHLQLD